MDNWTYFYCVSKTIEWLNYLLLTCLLGFLLALHCIMYKKLNKRCSLKIFKRNRVQILTLSIVMTSALFVKLTFRMKYADLVILLFAQLLRFVIWSLTLINFMKSGMDLIISSQNTKVILRLLKICTLIGVGFFSGYAIYLIVQEQRNDRNVLSCNSSEFLVQGFLLLAIVTIFLLSAIRTSRLLKAQIEASKGDQTFLAINTSRKAAMNNVWFLLIWLFVVAIEGFAFSLTVLLHH